MDITLAAQSPPASEGKPLLIVLQITWPLLLTMKCKKTSSAINNRRSSALFIADKEGKVTWRHLQ